MPFDPLTWAIGFGAGRAATKLLDKLGKHLIPTPLSKELAEAFRKWAGELPENAAVHPDVLMAAMFGAPEQQAGPARAALAEAFEDKQLPSADLWLNALMERWVEIASGDGDLQAFFRTSPAEAKARLRALSQSLYRICGRDAVMFQAAVLASQQEIERSLAEIRAMLETERSEPATAVLEERLRRFSSALLRYPTTLTPGGTWLERPELATLLDRIESTRWSLSVVIGERGSGKSALLAHLAARVRDAGFALLAIKADLLPASASTLFAQIGGGGLDLETVLATVARTKTVVVIVDQVDAIAEILDRTTDRLNVVLNLVHRIAETPNVHVVLSSREFEYRTDARLTSLQPDEVALQLPPWTDVAPVLAEHGHDPDAMGEVMRGLLRNPWTLKVFLDVAKRDEHFASLSALLDRVWTKVVAAGAVGDRRVALLDRMVARMIEEEEFSVPAAIADADPLPLETLLSEGILVRENQMLTFRHQTFFEYTAARRFGSGSADFLQHILGRQDGLFVRPTIVTTLVLLRDTRPQAYARIVRAILEHPDIRLHVKILVVDFVASQRRLLPSERELVPGLLGDDRFGKRILDAIGSSVEWYALLRDDERFTRWLGDPERARRCMPMLAAAIQQPGALRDVLRLLAKYWLQSKELDPLFDELLRLVRVPDAAVAAIVELLVVRSDLYGAFQVLEEVAPLYALRVLRADFEARLRDFEVAIEDDPENATAALAMFVREHPIELEDLSKRLPVEYFRMLGGPLLAIVAAVARSVDAVSSLLYPRNVRMISGFAMRFPDEFFDVVDGLEHASLVLHLFLAPGWDALALRYPARTADYLLRDSSRLVLHAAPRWVHSIHPLLHPDERMALEAAIDVLPYDGPRRKHMQQFQRELVLTPLRDQLPVREVHSAPPEPPPEEPTEAEIHQLIRERRRTDSSWDRLRRKPVESMSDAVLLRYLGHSSGGVSTGREVGKYLASDPGRFTTILRRMKRSRHAAIAPAIAEWLPSDIAFDSLQETIAILDRKGFTSCRTLWCAKLYRRVKAGEELDGNTITLLARWLRETEPDLATRASELPPAETFQSEPLLGGEHFIASTGTRGTILMVLSAALLVPGRADVARWESIVAESLADEHDRSFWHIVLRDLPEVFLYDRETASRVLRKLLESEGRLVTDPTTIWFLGRIFGRLTGTDAAFVLDVLRGHDSPVTRQALAELSFVCPRFDEVEIRALVSTGGIESLAGAGYGATYAWERSERRRLAADILVSVATAAREELDDVLQRFVADRYSEKSLDGDAERVLASMARYAPLSRDTTAILLDVLQSHTVSHPAFAHAMTSTLIERVGGDFDDLTRPFFVHAGPMTAIAITLHRQPAFRAAGLALFEKLLECNAREAHAAIEILDRRPGVRYRSVSWRQPTRRTRRTRVMMADA